MPKRDPYAQSQQPTKITPPKKQQPAKPKTLWDLLPPELAAPLRTVDRAATKARTPPKRTVPKTTSTGDFTTRKGDFGGGGDFKPDKPGTIPYKPPTHRPSILDPITKSVTDAVSGVQRGLTQSVVDNLVPHKPVTGPPPKPKNLFPEVKEPSDEQQMFVAQAANVAAQLKPIEKQVALRKHLFETLDQRTDRFIKEHATVEGGKLMFDSEETLKQAEQMQTKLHQAGNRLNQSIRHYQDRAGRIVELDQAYKDDVRIKLPPAPGPVRYPDPVVHAVRPTKDDPYGLRFGPQPVAGGFAPRYHRPPPPPGSHHGGGMGIPFITPLISLGERGFKGLVGQVKANQQQELYGQKNYEDMKIRQKQNELGRQLTLGEEQTLRAGIVPPGSTESAVNLAYATGGAISGAYHDPVGAIKDTGKLIAEAGIGSGLLFVSLADPRAGYHNWYERWGEFAKGAKGAYAEVASPSLSHGEAYDAGKKHPIATLSLLPLPLSAGAQGSRIAALVARGHSLAEATRIARDPSLIGKGRSLTYTERGAKLPGGGRQADVKTEFDTDWSKSVLWRNTGQRTYDALSWVVEQLPGARNLPFAEGKRALAAEAKNIRIEKHRRNAKAHAVYNDLLDFVEERNALGKKVNQHFKTTIAMLVQKPKGATNEEWERAVMTDLEQMIADPENMILTGEEASPAEARLIRRVETYRKEEEAGKFHKRNLTVRRIAQEQHRLSVALKTVTDQRHAIYDEYLDAQMDPDLKGAARTEEFGRYESAIKAIDTQAKVARESLDEISVDAPPIVSRGREQMRRTLQDIEYFKDYPEAINDAIAVGDASARASAFARKTTPAEEWDKIETVLVRQDEIPESAAAQTRAPTTPLKPTPEAARQTRNRAVHVRALRRGDSTWSEKMPDGTFRERNVSPKTMGRKFENEATYDEKGRLLFGGETQYGDVVGRLEEGFRDSFPDATDAEIAEKMTKAASFYKEYVFPYMGRVLSTREVQAWLASQVGASPARGVMDLMKVLDKALHKENLPSDKIGLAAQTMARIIYGERDLPKGFQSKISDFTDVGHGETQLRTFTGRDPDAGRPYVVDRWEARAHGVVDPDFIETLYKRFDATLQDQGYVSYSRWEELRKQASDFATAWAEAENKKRVAAKKDKVSLAQRDRKRDGELRRLEAEESKTTGVKVIKADIPGQPGDVLYEHIGSWGEGLADYLNEVEYLGKKDWDVSDAQALDWAGIQRYVGVHPENVDYALFSQARPVTFEIGAAGRFAKKYPEIGELPGPERLALTKYVADEIIDIAAKRSGVIPIRTTLGYGGYLTTVSPAIRSQVLSGDRMFAHFIDNVRDLTDEDEVWGSTFTGGGRQFHQVEIRNEAWRDDPEAMRAFWTQFNAAHPEFVGFAPLHEGGFASILTTEDLGAVGIPASKQTAIAATLKALHNESESLDVGFTTLRLQRSTRERSAHDYYMEEHAGGPGVGEPPAGTALRGGRADARAAAENVRFRTTRADRARVDARLREGLDILKRDGLAGLESRARLAGRIDDPEAVPHTTRITKTSRLEGIPEGEPRVNKAGKVIQPPVTLVLNQARRGDVLGATQMLDTVSGKRIIYLTEHADFSTVLHELVGHATDEMHALYPEEFAVVEQLRGKSYADFDRSDHEWVAENFERYLAEGHAPVPELVDVFDRAKQYMRVIWHSIGQKSGGRVPPATRDLFDTYLGGWADDTTSRVAMNMARFDPSSPVASGARVKAQTELLALQKRNRTRRFNQSLEGLVEQYKALVKKRDAGDATQEEVEQLTAEIYRRAGEIQMRADKRVQHLDGKLKDMQKALTRDPSNRRFDGAVAAAKWMTDDRERILKEVFGSDFDQIFSDRVDIVANYLVQKGLISPDFEKGTAGYWPHKLEETWLQSLKLPMMPTNNTVGQLQKTLLGLHKRNEMIRWQAGDWSSDPSVLWQAHARATSYQFMSDIKKLLHGMGRKLTADEWDGHFPPGAMLINLDGTPISLGLKEGLKGASNTHTVDRIDDGLFGDNDMLEGSLKKYWQNSVVDPNDLPPGFNLSEHPELRVISRAAVNKMFRPISLNLGWGGKTWDLATTMARFSLIYANVPGYMLTNGLGNAVFLMMQSPFNIPRAVWYSKMLLNDSHLRTQIYGETGELPAQAAITRGRNFGERIGSKGLALEKKVLDFESVVDRWPRMIAWLREANAAGYYKKADLQRLIAGKTPETRRDRRRVGEYANQHMIDFAYRVSDAEKAILGRAFFIWPYIRGATAQPFWYAKNYPGRTAAVALLAQQQVDRQEQMVGELPPGREDLYPVKVRGHQAEVIPTRFFSPAGPLPDYIKLLSDSIASLNGRPPDNLSSRLAMMLSPLAEGSMNVFTGRDYFGRDVSLKSQVLDSYGIADSLVPYLRYVRAAFWDDSNEMTPRAAREGENTMAEKLERQIIRINKQTYSIPWLNAAAQRRGTKTTEEKIATAVAANMKHFHEVEGAGEPYPRTVRRQVVAKVVYEDRLHQLELDRGHELGFEPTPTEDGMGWDTKYHADEYDKAVVAHDVMMLKMHEVIVGTQFEKSPNEYLLERGLPPRSIKGLDAASRYNTFFNDMLARPPGPEGIRPAADYDTQALDRRQLKTYRGEKKRGVYRNQKVVAGG